MTPRITADEILKLNKHLSAGDLKGSRDLLQQLRASGLRPRGYGLAIPYANSDVSVDDPEKGDQKAVHISRER